MTKHFCGAPRYLHQMHKTTPADTKAELLAPESTLPGPNLPHFRPKILNNPTIRHNETRAVCAYRFTLNLNSFARIPLNINPNQGITNFGVSMIFISAA